MAKRWLKRVLTNRVRNLIYNLSSLYALKTGINERFMNFGYDGGTLEIRPGDEEDKLHIQLYNLIATGVDFKDKTVLETGCGRGGGCYFLKEYLGAKKVTGTDLSANNIKIAGKLVAKHSVVFSKQNAEELSFPPNSFDIIVSLESAHAYPHRKKFYRAVFSLLKQGGKFVYADIFKTENVPLIKEHLCSLGFKAERATDITDGVIRSLQLKRIKRFSFLKKKVIPLFFKSFYGINEGHVYNALKEGRTKYVSFVFTKL